MYISGYHGTSLEAAQKIYKTKEFFISDKDKEWLGDGVYFYFNVDDAVKWRDSDAIVYAIIDVPTESLLDLDTDDGKYAFSAAMELLLEKYSGNRSLLGDVEMNQCAIMRILWNNCPSIEVMAGSFPTEKSKGNALIDVRKRRREFCVRNNKPIKYIHYIRKERLQ